MAIFEPNSSARGPTISELSTIRQSHGAADIDAARLPLSDFPGRAPPSVCASTGRYTQPTLAGRLDWGICGYTGPLQSGGSNTTPSHAGRVKMRAASLIHIGDAPGVAGREPEAP